MPVRDLKRGVKCGWSFVLGVCVSCDVLVQLLFFCETVKFVLVELSHLVSYIDDPTTRPPVSPEDNIRMALMFLNWLQRVSYDTCLFVIFDLAFVLLQILELLTKQALWSWSCWVANCRRYQGSEEIFKYILFDIVFHFGLLNYLP